MDHTARLVHSLRHQEWSAWQNVARSWPGDMNEPRFQPMVDWCRFWGESYVQLSLKYPAIIEIPDIRQIANEQFSTFNDTFESELKALAKNAHVEEWQIKHVMSEKFFGLLYTWARSLVSLRRYQDEETRQVAYEKARMDTCYGSEQP